MSMEKALALAALAKAGQGGSGEDGKSVFIRYSSNADGSGMTETWSAGQNYIGFMTGEEASEDNSDYTWSLFKGDSGNPSGNILQTTGTSTIDTMSQKAITDETDSIKEDLTDVNSELGLTFKPKSETIILESTATIRGLDGINLKAGEIYTFRISIDSAISAVVYSTLVQSDGTSIQQLQIHDGQTEKTYVFSPTEDMYDIYWVLQCSVNPIAVELEILNNGFETATEKLFSQTKRLASELSSVTNTYSVDVFDGAFHEIFVDGSASVITPLANARTAFIQLKPGAKYDITAIGSFSRFRVYVSNFITLGTTGVVTKVRRDTPTSTEKYTYIADSEYSWMMIYLGTEGDITSFEVIENFNSGETFKVRGIEVPTAESVESAIDARFNWRIKECETLNNYGASNGKIANSTGLKGALVKVDKDQKYAFTISGKHNRAYIAGYIGENPEVGSDVITVYNTGITQATEEDTVFEYNNELYDYIIATLSFDLNDANPHLTVSNRDSTSYKVNGLDIYSKEEVEIAISEVSVNAENCYTSELHPIFTSTEDLYAAYDELLESFSDYVTKNEIGEDEDGTKLYEYVFSNETTYNSRGQRSKDTAVAKSEILIITGVHGYERVSIAATYLFCKNLCECNKKLGEIRNRFVFRVVPVVCPYGFDNDSRTNKNGVNINRNFAKYWYESGAGTYDYSGLTAASELETQAIQDWIDNHTSAALFIDYHNSGYADEVSYLAGLNSVSGMDGVKGSYLKALGNVETYLIGKEHFAEDNIFAYTGDFGTVAMSYKYAEDKGIISTCFEGSWNVNSFGKDSQISVKTGAETFGNFLIEYLNNI